MRTLWIAAVGLGLAVAQTAHANVILEDFNEPAISIVRSQVGGEYGMIRVEQSPWLLVAYGVYNVNPSTASVGVDATHQTFNFSGTGVTYGSIGFGYAAPNGSDSMLNNSDTSMNADWSQYSALRINIGKLQGDISLVRLTIGKNNTVQDQGTIELANPIALKSPGAIDIAFSDLIKGPYGNGLTDMTDVDSVYIAIAINSGAGSIVLNSIELVSVPEPATGLLAAVGIAGMLLRRRRTH